MGKQSCDINTREIIIQMHQDETSYRGIATALKVSKTMVFKAGQYFRKYSADGKVPYKQRSQITTCPQVEKNMHKLAKKIRIAIFGENGAKPSVHTVQSRLREAESFGRISGRNHCSLSGRSEYIHNWPLQSFSQDY